MLALRVLLNKTNQSETLQAIKANVADRNSTNAWTITCSLPRHVRNKLYQEQNSQDLS